MSRKLTIPWFRGEGIKVPIWLAVLGFVAITAGVLEWVGRGVSWTGFGEQTLWHWMDLLVIPAALGVAAWWFNKQERESDRDQTQQRVEGDTLQKFLDSMTELLLREKLQQSKEGEPAQTVAQARTEAVLRSLDRTRKSIVVQFLARANLVSQRELTTGEVGKESEKEDSTLPPVISLKEADLDAVDLRGANFRGANLEKANLGGADLREARHKGANLKQANLRWANLEGSNFQGAFLTGANLEGSNLRGAFLTMANVGGATFTGANLEGTNFRGANVTDGQLASARSRKGAIMPDGTVHD